MPRPGPRPYECVRRAWHSDRHQPIRGSLIQEIFRVVSEIHSSATKRNKEWQEKLPIVVLKAEEIMYSKANSEGEYMDLTTLWDRANDAINTIVRLDDSSETGDLLQPCIEAALHLGCIPRKASRSQCDNDPRRYLSPNLQEPLSICLSNLKKSITSPHCMAMYSNIFSNCPLSKMGTPEDNIPFKNSPLRFLPESSSSKSMAPDTCIASVNGNSVYPLYYWGDDPQLPVKFFPVKKFTPIEMNSPNKCEVPRFSILPPTTPPLTCDLSLRLGPSCGVKEYKKQCHNQEFQNTKSKSSASMELHLFPNEDDAKYLHLDKPGQKRKAPSLAGIPRRAEEMICLSESKLPLEKPQIIKYPGL